MKTTIQQFNDSMNENDNEQKDFRFHSHGAVVFFIYYYVVVQIEERLRWFVFFKMQCKQNIAICGITGFVLHCFDVDGDRSMGDQK